MLLYNQIPEISKKSKKLFIVLVISILITTSLKIKTPHYNNFFVSSI